MLYIFIFRGGLVYTFASLFYPESAHSCFTHTK
nr:MAG TPA: hypothetical protein [Caudoviricetes sp.]